MKVEMTVNGKKVRADTLPSLLLSDFLRENLNLTGTHVLLDAAVGHPGAAAVTAVARRNPPTFVFATTSSASSIPLMPNTTMPDGRSPSTSAMADSRSGG